MFSHLPIYYIYVTGEITIGEAFYSFLIFYLPQLTPFNPYCGLKQNTLKKYLLNFMLLRAIFHFFSAYVKYIGKIAIKSSKMTNLNKIGSIALSKPQLAYMPKIVANTKIRKE